MESFHSIQNNVPSNLPTSFEDASKEDPSLLKKIYSSVKGALSQIANFFLHLSCQIWAVPSSIYQSLFRKITVIKTENDLGEKKSDKEVSEKPSAKANLEEDSPIIEISISISPNISEPIITISTEAAQVNREESSKKQKTEIVSQLKNHPILNQNISKKKHILKSA